MKKLLLTSAMVLVLSTQVTTKINADESKYLVKSGDTLSKIAKNILNDDSEDTINKIVIKNKIKDKDLIMVGQELDLNDLDKVDYTENSINVSYNLSTIPSSQDVQSNVQYTASQGGSVILANGNTAGEIGTSAAAQMAAATGVSQSVWEQIIARESNGNMNAYNPSGASGLFQTMPGWGSTATVQDQINSAINAYNAQGLSAWGY